MNLVSRYENHDKRILLTEGNPNVSNNRFLSQEDYDLTIRSESSSI